MRLTRVLASIATLATAAASLFALTPADAAVVTQGVQHLHFSYGPVHIRTGQNIIEFNNHAVPKPAQDGWIVGIRPNLHLSNGTIPPVDVIHLHHAVWLNASASDTTTPEIGRAHV